MDKKRRSSQKNKNRAREADDAENMLDELDNMLTEISGDE